MNQTNEGARNDVPIHACLEKNRDPMHQIAIGRSDPKQVMLRTRFVIIRILSMIDEQC